MDSNSDVCNKKHKFWSSHTGSQLILTLITPPENQLKCLELTVSTIAKPHMYTIRTILTDGSYDTVHLNKKEAIRFVSSNWMNFYKNRTDINFKEHLDVDMSTIGCGDLRIRSPSPISSNSSNCQTKTKRDLSSSPRSWIHKRLSLPPRTYDDSNSDSNSPKSPNTPKSPSTTNTTSNTTSNTSSPRSSPSSSPFNSPRNDRDKDLRRSLHVSSTLSNESSPRSNVGSPRSNENSPRSPRLLGKLFLRRQSSDIVVKKQSSDCIAVKRQSSEIVVK